MEHYVILHNQVPRYVHRDLCYAAMAKYVALHNATYLAIATVFGPKNQELLMWWWQSMLWSSLRRRWWWSGMVVVVVADRKQLSPSKLSRLGSISRVVVGGRRKQSPPSKTRHLARFRGRWW